MPIWRLLPSILQVIWYPALIAGTFGPFLYPLEIDSSSSEQIEGGHCLRQEFCIVHGRVCPMDTP
jgi:hypothetical protein